MKVVRVEPTPNPSAYKFVADQPLIQVGVRQFNDAAEAAGDDLAKKLFAIAGVSTVYYTQNFLTLTLGPDHDWGEVQSGVNDALSDYHAPNQSGQEDGSGASNNEDERMTQIRNILESRVAPYLAADGGGMEILGLDGNTLHIRYQGACGSCPSSTAGTLQAITNMLKSEVDEEIEVINV